MLSRIVRGDEIIHPALWWLLLGDGDGGGAMPARQLTSNQPTIPTGTKEYWMAAGQTPSVAFGGRRFPILSRVYAIDLNQVTTAHVCAKTKDLPN